MRLLPTRLVGLVLIEPEVHRDDRGFFLETYRFADYQRLGITSEFVQDNHSRSPYGTLRGLHYQAEPGQAKLVRVVRGTVLDVAVDLRRSSLTFGQYESFELDDVQHRQLFIPVGFAHGFVVLSDQADVVYKVGSYYNSSSERGLAWNDPALGIRWPLTQPTVSPRDASNPTLSSLLKELPRW